MNDNAIYHQKYLKYKAKYLELRKLIGGTKDNCICHEYNNNGEHIKEYSRKYNPTTHFCGNKCVEKKREKGSRCSGKINPGDPNNKPIHKKCQSNKCNKKTLKCE